MAIEKRLTELQDTRVTEAGDTRILEGTADAPPIQNEFVLYSNGVRVAALPNVVTFEYEYIRNRFMPGDLTYNANKLPSTLKDNIILGNEIRVFRKGANDLVRKLVYAGEIVNIAKVIENKDQKSYRIKIDPNGNKLGKRTVTKTISVAKEESTIAWDDIVNETQLDTVGGAFTAAQVTFGITQGTLETTGNNRTREFDQDNPLKVLAQLADAPDIGGNPQRLRGFRITPDLVTDTYNVFSWEATYGTDRSGDIIYTRFNITRIVTEQNIEQYANRVITLGAGGLQDAQNSTNTTDLDKFKMRQLLINKTNIKNSDDLEEASVEELATRELRPTTLQIEIIPNDTLIGQFTTGDIIRIKYEDVENFINIDANYIVFGIRIRIESNGIEQATLDLAAEKPVSVKEEPASQITSFITKANQRFIELEKQ
jgi:hypothetical protein